VRLIETAASSSKTSHFPERRCGGSDHQSYIDPHEAASPRSWPPPSQG
jgi:hypothetical protein